MFFFKIQRCVVVSPILPYLEGILRYIMLYPVFIHTHLPKKMFMISVIPLFSHCSYMINIRTINYKISPLYISIYLYIHIYIYMSIYMYMYEYAYNYSYCYFLFLGFTPISSNINHSTIIWKELVNHLPSIVQQVYEEWIINDLISNIKQSYEKWITTIYFNKILPQFPNFYLFLWSF